MEELDGFNEHYFGVQQMFLDNVKSISSQFAVRGKYLRPYSAGFRQQLQVMLDRHGKDWWGPEQMRDRGQ